MNYSPFEKDTDCLTCLGCSRCEDVTFRGKKNCGMYRPAYNEEKDEVVRRYEQDRIKAVYNAKE